MKLDICAFIKRYFLGLTRPGQLSAPLGSRHGFMFLTSSEIQLGMYVTKPRPPFHKVQSWFGARYLLRGIVTSPREQNSYYSVSLFRIKVWVGGLGSWRVKVKCSIEKCPYMGVVSNTEKGSKGIFFASFQGGGMPVSVSQCQLLQPASRSEERGAGAKVERKRK